MRFTEDFPATTESQWRDAVAGVLKGRDFARALIGRTVDGIAIEPILPRARLAEPIAAPRGAGRWSIAARLDDPDAERGNRLLLEELEGGADAVTLTFAGHPAARGFGLPDHTPRTLDRALEGVHLDLLRVRIESAPFGGRATAEAIAALARRRRLPGATLAVDFGLAPLADWAATGHMPLAFGQAMANSREILAHLLAEGFKGPFLRADGRPFHDAGASDAQELAIIAAQVIAYLRGLDSLGVPPRTARDWLSVTLAVDDDQFLAIAKLRALRLVLARIDSALGLPPRAVPVHAETAWRMMTRDDCHTNILRTTIAGLAAGLGGADSIAILPFTIARGLPDGFARRLARNTSLILLDESNLHRVIDPVAGAGAIEALTDRLSEHAWALLQRIESQAAEGEAGLPAALANGFLAELLRETRDARGLAIARRKEPITGVSEFPDLGEGAVAVLAPAPKHRSGGPLPPMRLAEPFEALRDRAQALAEAGEPPRVFLANLGPLASFNTRATFARAAFEAGGVAGLANNGFETLDALVEAFRASGATLACLCSSDAIYAEPMADGASMAEHVARLLKAAGARALWLAGKPEEREEALRAAGIDGFLFAGCDILAFLADALDRSEVTR